MCQKLKTEVWKPSPIIQVLSSMRAFSPLQEWQQLGQNTLEQFFSSYKVWCSHFAIPKDLTIHFILFTLYSLVLIFSVIALISISKVNNPRLYIHLLFSFKSIQHTQICDLQKIFVPQNLLCLVYPWIICTVLTTILDVTVDIWLLRKVEIYSI